MATHVTLNLTSTSPLLMHAPTSVDPLHPMVKDQKKVSAKRKKTDEDHDALSRYDFLMGMYYSEEMGVYLPTTNVWKSIQEAARMSKSGPKIEKGVSAVGMGTKLIYNGPETPEELYEEPNFRSRMVVGVQRARVMRTRPIFHHWATEVTFSLHTELIDVEEFLGFAKLAGELIGVGDFRKGGYGRFAIAE